MLKRHHRDHTVKSAVDILIELHPTLVDDLAGLANESLTDLRIAFQVMPWADRAALAHHGLIELEHQPGGAGKVKKVHPIALEVVQAAYERYDFSEAFGGFANNDSDDESRLPSAKALPKVDIVTDLGNVARQVLGRVNAVQQVGGLESVLIQVRLQSDQRTGIEEPTFVEVAPWPRAVVHEGDDVVLGYRDSDADLDDPVAISIQGTGEVPARQSHP